MAFCVLYDILGVDKPSILLYDASVLNDTPKGDEDLDKEKLMNEMSKCGISIGEMTAKLGMSRSAFYRKCNGISEFTRGEIQHIVDILNLDSPVGIFFAEKVS